tara:strand:- start:10 stop:834 length:825 start_codon:yes stop_codon:yes gene_type:complete
MREARDTCLAAIRRKLPKGLASELTADKILTEANVRRAIKDQRGAKCPGSDGLTSEFYQCYIDEMAPLLLQTYKERYAEGGLTDSMNEAVVSLLYKLNNATDEQQQTKGGRENWNNYRPVSCLNVDYKIYAKLITQHLEDAIPHVISAAQLGFQPNKYIGEATMLAQLVTSRCHQKKLPGLMMLVDGEKAYDLVQHDWLREVMGEMGFPAEFIDLALLMYAAPSSSMKVNGWVSEPFTAKNAVRQGCPCSCYLYILSLQPLLSMIESGERLKGD